MNPGVIFAKRKDVFDIKFFCYPMKTQLNMCEKWRQKKNISKYEAFFYFLFFFAFLFHRQLEFHKITRHQIISCIAEVCGRRQLFLDLAVWIGRTGKGWWWQLKDENWCLKANELQLYNKLILSSCWAMHVFLACLVMRP